MKKQCYIKNLLLSYALLSALMLTAACQEQSAETETQMATTTTTTTTSEITTTIEITTVTTTASATAPLPAAVVFGEAELFETAVSFSNGITVRLSLPADFSLAEAESNNGYLPVTGHEMKPFGYCHIVKDGRAVGAISTAGMDLANFVEGQKEAFLDGEHPSAMYNSFMLGSMYTWNVDYTNVTPVGELIGSATCLVYYRSDGLPEGEGKTKPHAKAEKAYDSDFDDRVNYYNRGILAYNFELETYIGVELDYDCINDATHTAIARTVQIIENTDDTDGLQIEAIDY
jgi:hypothetical protein